MKKIYFLFFLTFFFSKVYPQNSKDTLYINPNNNESLYQAIFIERPNSIYHKMVFDILLSDSNTYNDNVKQNIKRKAYLGDTINSKYIGDWISIHKYKKNFYAYFPSEPYFNTFIKITDSTLVINDFNEGLTPYKITYVTQKKNKIILTLQNNHNLKHSIFIQQKSKGRVKIKSSLINVNKITFVNKQAYFELPIIVNYCPLNRCQEFKF